MSQIIIAPRIEDPLSDVESVASSGYFQIRPSAAYSAGGQWVLPVWSDPEMFTGSPIPVQLDPLVVPYELKMNLPDGEGGMMEITEFRIVPSSGTPLAWDSLTQVSGPAGGPVLVDALTARVTALEAALGGFTGGGATNLAGITDMSAFMRTVNDDTSAGAARTTLGAADDTTVVHLAGTETLTGAKTVGTLTVTTAATVPTPTTAGHATTKGYVDGLVVSPTPDATNLVKGKVQLAGDLAGPAGAPTVPGLATLQTQITGLTAPDWSAVTGKPNVAVLDGASQLPLINLPIYAVVRIGNGGVTVPIRPSYPGPVDFYCSTEPPRTGTTAGGTAAAAPGDGWLRTGS